MTPPPPLFHALLRPAVLQILRATGYHGAKTSVLDSVTDLAARYFFHLCELTALYATHNNDSIPEDEELHDHDRPPHSLLTNGVDGPTTTSPPPPSLAPATATNPATGGSVVVLPVPAPTIVDVRMALQRAGALLPERLEEEQAYFGAEDMRGVEGFVAWAMGPLNREITRIALDGNDEAGDYLDGEFFLSTFSRTYSWISVESEVNEARGEKKKKLTTLPALKKKHSKNDDDSKYLGTLLGRGIEHGSVLVEGGECPSISVWEERRRAASQKTPEPPLPVLQRGGVNGDGDGEGDGDGDGEESRPASSGLSSLGDRSIADEMDLS